MQTGQPSFGIYESLVGTRSLEPLRNNPDSLLATIKMFGLDSSNDPVYLNQLQDLVADFDQLAPTSVLFIGAETDFAYSVLYLANEFLKTGKQFVLHAVFNTASLSEDMRKVLLYLVDSSGIVQIRPHLCSNLELFLSDQSSEYDWILINHRSSETDLKTLRLLESVSIVQPGVAVARINYPVQTDTEFNRYLLGSPVYKRNANDLCGGRRPGRWNLLYEKVGVTPTHSDLVLAQCIDFLNA